MSMATCKRVFLWAAQGPLDTSGHSWWQTPSYPNIVMAHGIPLPPGTEPQLDCKPHDAPPSTAAIQACHDLMQRL